MNRIFLYTIWRRVEDLIENPEWRKLSLELEQIFADDPEAQGATAEVESLRSQLRELPQMITDPNNPRGVRYVAVKVVDSIDVAQTVCAHPSGEYTYTIAEAWYGENV
ncbi:hypothetical protein MADRUGA_102 [Mycobacterium phage Madruga]|uniref:Uncharacterized protein n=1 Tax=Mycobacterium phage Madruga TaxID=1675552 RepID=A0A0K1LS34_9CAUD|nr:hypothetical protein MADRUGA_102 [Mycobacterium phage Madruga]